MLTISHLSDVCSTAVSEPVLCIDKLKCECLNPTNCVVICNAGLSVCVFVSYNNITLGLYLCISEIMCYCFLLSPYIFTLTITNSSMKMIIINIVIIVVLIILVLLIIIITIQSS